MVRIRARWVFPGNSTPLSNGVVTLAGGIIQGVEPAGSPADIDLPEAAIIPGLLNAHTHLEFSDLVQPIEPRQDFATWIRNVIAQRRSRQGTGVQSIHSGLAESSIAGITGLAEIATSEVMLEESLLRGKNDGPRVFLFREILGLNPENIEQNVQIAQSFIQKADCQGVRKIGLSPHAPYSLHPELFIRLCQLAADRQLPVAMHLAESRSELELLSSGTGPLVDLFNEMGLWRRNLIPLHSRPMNYLRSLADLPWGLIIHGNYLTGEELEFIAAQPRMSVVYCPRTHFAMQPDPHPWRQMLARGINVCLGTDSRASNPDLSIWGELRFLARQFPSLPAEELLALATTRAARALDWKSCGQISPGFDADLCLVSLTREGIDDPQRLFEGSITRPMRGGCWTTLNEC
jgi:cytosine/adenosine deaminase-related metal-dependent hydrolase